MTMNIYDVGIGETVIGGGETGNGIPFIGIERQQHGLEQGEQLVGTKIGKDATILQFRTIEGARVMQKVINKLIEKYDGKPWPMGELVYEVVIQEQP